MIQKSTPPSEVGDAEARYLERFGHKQVLHRAMGWYSSFALSVAVLAVTITLFTLYGAGFQSIGGAAVWIWVAVILFGVLSGRAGSSALAALSLGGLSWLPGTSERPQSSSLRVPSSRRCCSHTRPRSRPRSSEPAPL
jgi:TRAP-type uncharacterized transport system fused permease subunit